jgi:tRNA(fMet)-specific endonuclease VapC
MYLLDTNVVSALMRGDPQVVENLRRLRKQDVAVPQPVLAELAYGIARLPRSRRKERLTRRLRLIRDELARAAWTDEVSDQFGAVKAALERRGERIEDLDAAIAAHALAVSGTLVTADQRHLARVPGLEVVDWQRPR